MQDRNHAGAIHKEGNVGIVSRSGTLTYEAVHQLRSAASGSRRDCIGGDPIIGTNFVDALDLFNRDPRPSRDHDREIGGNAEETAAEFIKLHMKSRGASSPGKTAPPGRRMGHAGAIISGARARGEKIAAMEKAGLKVAKSRRTLAKR